MMNCSYNVCCQSTQFKIILKRSVYQFHNLSFVFLINLNIVYFINNKLPYRNRFVFKRTFRMFSLCDICATRKRDRCDFYHLTRRKTLYTWYLKCYFKNNNYDYVRLSELTIYELELDLRKELFESIFRRKS